MTDDPSSARGEVTWHSSDEDSGPDVGLSIGLGDGRVLYVGEVSKDMADRSDAPDDLGWHLVLYPEAESFASFHDAEKAREFFEVMERTIGLTQAAHLDASLAAHLEPIVEPAMRSALNTLRTWSVRRHANSKTVTWLLAEQRLHEIWPDAPHAKAARVLLEIECDER